MSSQPAAPEVRLGEIRSNGIAPTMFALIERGVHRHPSLARTLRGRVVVRFNEGYAPARMSFGKRVIRVEDGDLRRADLSISGRLPDIIHLATAPLRGGVPDPMDGRGRRAILHLATGRVRIRGDRRLARDLLELMALRRPPDRNGGVEAPGPAEVGQGRWIDVLV